VKVPHCRSAQVLHAMSRDLTVLSAHPRIYPRTTGMNHTCLCLPSQSWFSFADAGRMEGRVGPGTATVSKQSAQDRYVTAITAVSCSSCHASLGNCNTGSIELSGRKPRHRPVTHRVTRLIFVERSTLLTTPAGKPGMPYEKGSLVRTCLVFVFKV